MKKIVILGAGMVGKAMAIDLSDEYEIISADINKNSLEFLEKTYQINTKLLDVNQKDDLLKLIKPADIVISAVPGYLGYEVLKTVIKAQKDIVDISFMPEDVLELNELAVKNNVTAIVDCGVAPGMPNLILGYYNEKMRINYFEYMVGGLPVIRDFPFEYKAPFSPCDVIEEYTRPARFMENGNVIVKPAMSDLELVKFDKIGTLEAFNSDGLRSLLYTMKHIPNMKEKTLRFPGHIKMIKALKEAGFFDNNPLQVKEQKIIPFEVTSEILYHAWKLNPGDEEFTVMRIMFEGIENGKPKKIEYNMHDTYDHIENISSMARTTGFVATAVADMVLNDVFNGKGVFPPELIGKYTDCFHYVMGYLQERNIHYMKKES